MKFTPHTIPDVLIDVKNKNLNHLILQRLNGSISAPPNVKSVLKDLYNGTNVMGKDTISLFLRSDETKYDLTDLKVRSRDYDNKTLLKVLLESLTIEDLVNIIKIIR